MNAMRPIHPGEVLREELTEIGMTASAFAQALHVPPNRITAILKGTRSITARYRAPILPLFRHHRRVLAEFADGL